MGRFFGRERIVWIFQQEKEDGSKQIIHYPGHYDLQEGWSLSGLACRKLHPDKVF